MDHSQKFAAPNFKTGPAADSVPLPSKFSSLREHIRPSDMGKSVDLTVGLCEKDPMWTDVNNGFSSDDKQSYVYVSAYCYLPGFLPSFATAHPANGGKAIVLPHGNNDSSDETSQPPECASAPAVFTEGSGRDAQMGKHIESSPWLRSFEDMSGESCQADEVKYTRRYNWSPTRGFITCPEEKTDARRTCEADEASAGMRLSANIAACLPRPRKR